VRKASQPYRLSGPVADRERAQRGDVLFFRQPALPPGTYRLEVAIHDALAQRAGVQMSSFVVPAATPERLQVSSLVVVRRGERLSGTDQQADNPLVVADVMLFPNLGDPIRRGDRAVTLFVSIVPGSNEVPSAALDVQQDDATLSTMPIRLDRPDAGRRIQQVVGLPIDKLPAGDYVLRLIVTQGNAREVRDATIRVVD
jgi:hypothetical protein